MNGGLAVIKLALIQIINFLSQFQRLSRRRLNFDFHSVLNSFTREKNRALIVVVMAFSTCIKSK
ncbi:Uncharacterised protein [Vibrio cholerae]|nr:Uncharacterised protein [Vibrio cholerae]CSC27054.1 Uncharacterised protein [Vibrio cholerae]